ncbi:hypothetical protein [Capillibacterium thermochitinicola]|uniref:Uncharacterized protein n=1 Tax=Capillibacterium thermochitinicola TaxID=2699427 RepID=A0A8J6I1S7_9FIRM|nr:hypothetical protein [Capillibacterium thermochitinicola]MBA2134100.1 hypothetical protein [Capillibacterium thermochitinicola]
MSKYTKEELTEGLQVILSIIKNCEKMQLKFLAGTSQHSLLKNRIKALCISKALMANDCSVENYTKEELLEALPPITSIISKSEKAQLKIKEGTPHYTRLKKIINAMQISKSLITKEIDKKSLGD